MRIAPILLCCLALTVMTTGCGEAERATPAAAPAPATATPAGPVAAPSTVPYSEGGSMKPFYGEVFHDGRYYLFGTKVEFTKFVESHESNPLISKTYIGDGPNGTTVICQKPKESPSMAGRLINQCRKRYSLPPIE